MRSLVEAVKAVLALQEAEPPQNSLPPCAACAGSSVGGQALISRGQHTKRFFIFACCSRVEQRGSWATEAEARAAWKERVNG